MIFLLRANHANAFELQNYVGLKGKFDLQVITSHHPLTALPLPSHALWSPTDLPAFPYRRQIMNRLFGGEQWLLGLSPLIQKRYNDLNHDITLHTAETYTPYTHQAVQLRKQGRITKLVCTCWETIPHANEKFARLRVWKREAYHYVDIFHVPTVRAKEALVAEGVDPVKIIVIPYGVDLNRFESKDLQGQALKACLRRQGKRCVVLIVARLEKEKGMDTITQVAAQLPQYDFLVVGQGTYNPRGSNIKIRSVPYSDIHKVYQSADLFFLPSHSSATWEEQYGMALVEAMATGLPILAVGSGAIPEVLGNAGLTCEVEDVDKMVKTIRSLLTSPAKYQKYSSLSLAQAVARYDSRKITPKLAKLYDWDKIVS